MSQKERIDKDMRPMPFNRDFQRWAFGVKDDIIMLDAYAMEMWNFLHGDKLTLYEDGNVAHDIGLMWDIWLQEKTLDQADQVEGSNQQGY